MAREEIVGKLSILSFIDWILLALYSSDLLREVLCIV